MKTTTNANHIAPRDVMSARTSFSGVGGSEEAPSARPAKFVNTFSGKPCADAVRLQEAQTTRDTNTAASSTTNCRFTDWTCSHALTL